MIVATAGHVDHGKTQLVKAITGIDTDTLAEEKKRGLSIDIGFAYLPIEGQPSIGFIDVPGHDRFIKNALCGLSAANFILLVVAADDGPMPQTEEHLSVIDLLDTRNGAIVISKIDRVSSNLVEEVDAKIKQLVKNTLLSNWPTFQVSSISNNGIDELKSFLVQHHLTAVGSKPDLVFKTNFRLAVDRVFEKKGAGLIVTGTIFAGRVSLNDRVTLAGSKMQLRVRSLHVHNKEAEFGMQGQRCAINLAGSELRKGQIKRGDWVVSDQVSTQVNRFDAEICIINTSPRPLTHWTPVHLHHAASESTARVAVLENKPIKPGEKGLVQIVSDHPISAVFGDNFIIRDQSAKITLGGGKVIDIFPPKRGRCRPDRIEWLKQLKQGDTQAALQALLSSCPAGVNLHQYAVNRNLTEQAASEVFQQQVMIELNEKKQRVGFSNEMIKKHCDSILQALKSCHLQASERHSFSESELLGKAKFPFPLYLLKTFLVRLLKESAVKNNSGGYSLASHKNAFNQEESALWQAVNQAMIKTGIRGMTIREVAVEVDFPAKQLKFFLVKIYHDGLIVKLATSLYILPSCLTQLRKLLEQLIKENDEEFFTVAEFRRASGIGRNRCIEILECFDTKGITRRIDEGRKILPAATDVFDKLLKKVN